MISEPGADRFGFCIQFSAFIQTMATMTFRALLRTRTWVSCARQNANSSKYSHTLFVAGPQRCALFSTSAHSNYAKPASKKGVPIEEKAILGRPSNNLKSKLTAVVTSTRRMRRKKKEGTLWIKLDLLTDQINFPILITSRHPRCPQHWKVDLFQCFDQLLCTRRELPILHHRPF